MGRKGGLASFSAAELETLRKFYNRTPGLTDPVLHDAFESAQEKSLPYIAYEVQQLVGGKES
jgi:hypothetical protein